MRHASSSAAGRRGSPSTCVSTPGLLETLAEPGSHEEAFARAQTARSVQEAVSTLPPKLRLAILLRYFDELSYEEIAGALHCSIGTVASRLNRGHRMLAKALASLRDSRGSQR